MSLLSGPGTFKHIVQIESQKLTFYLNSVIVKLRANRQKTIDKLGPEIGFVMA